MSAQKIINGDSDEQVFQQINADFKADPDLLEYDVIIKQAGRKILLEIDIDPGGGFESGYESTTLSAALQNDPAFRFAIHHEGVLDEIGKFFGMQDIITGYPEFDKKVVVKTDDEESVKLLFENAGVRSAFGSLLDFTFGITRHHIADEKKAPFLEFEIERAILDADELKVIYNAFLQVLVLVDP